MSNTSSNDVIDLTQNSLLRLRSLIGQYFKIKKNINYNLIVIKGKLKLKKKHIQWIELLKVSLSSITNIPLDISESININNVEFEINSIIKYLEFLMLNNSIYISYLFKRYFYKYTSKTYLNLNQHFKSNKPVIVNKNSHHPFFIKNIFFSIQKYLTMTESFKHRRLCTNYSILSSIPYKIGGLNCKVIKEKYGSSYLLKVIGLIVSDWGINNILSYDGTYREAKKLLTNNKCKLNKVCISNIINGKTSKLECKYIKDLNLINVHKDKCIIHVLSDQQIRIQDTHHITIKLINNDIKQQIFVKLFFLNSYKIRIWYNNTNTIIDTLHMTICDMDDIISIKDFKPTKLHF